MQILVGKYVSKYQQRNIILTTKHNKAEAAHHSFSLVLKANIVEYASDTDVLGTFSGEIERLSSPKECIKQKCLIGMNALNESLGLASEGSFGPHPYIGLIPADIEMMMFIDRDLDFEICLTEVDINTNFNAKKLDTIEDLNEFAKNALFPSHGLIVRPNIWNDKLIIFKGVVDCYQLKEAFEFSKKNSNDSKVWVETDMRANFNPSRMQVIRKLSQKMAERLLSNCPKCNTPAFGIVKTEQGLECLCCEMKTDLVKYFLNGCVKCDYIEKYRRTDIEYADMANCKHCNP